MGLIVLNPVSPGFSAIEQSSDFLILNLSWWLSSAKVRVFLERQSLSPTHLFFSLRCVVLLIFAEVVKRLPEIQHSSLTPQHFTFIFFHLLNLVCMLVYTRHPGEFKSDHNLQEFLFPPGEGGSLFLDISI